MEEDIVRIVGHEYWGSYTYLVTANGHALLKIYFDTRLPQGMCEVGEVNTHKDYRRRGHATRLIQCAERIAVNNGCHGVLLWTHRGSWQQRWYERMGYVVEGNMRTPSGDDETVWLSKTLTDGGHGDE